MKKTSKKQKPQIVLNPNYNPDNVITVRRYGVKDLERYLDKIRQNIKIFEEAISKERAEMKKTQGMIKVLETDIKEAKMFKRLRNK